MRTISAAERRTLRAKAHHLHAVVSVGQHGLTPAVLHEIDINLMAHELIKVKVFADVREERDALLERICTELDAAPVQHIGKLFVIWRPIPEEVEVKKVARPLSRPRRGAKSSEAAPRADVKAKRVRTLPTGKSAPQARRTRESSARGGARGADAGRDVTAPRTPGAARGPSTARTSEPARSPRTSSPRGPRSPRGSETPEAPRSRRGSSGAGKAPSTTVTASGTRRRRRTP